VNSLRREEVINGKRQLALDIAITMFEKKRMLLEEGRVRRALVEDRGIPIWAYSDLVSERVLIPKGGLIEFFHQTLWEFAAGKAVIEPGKMDELCDKIDAPTHRGVAEQVLLQCRGLRRQELVRQLAEELATCGLLGKCRIERLRSVVFLHQGQ
jgi:hypothetical protein